MLHISLILILIYVFLGKIFNLFPNYSIHQICVISVFSLKTNFALNLGPE